MITTKPIFDTTKKHFPGNFPTSMPIEQAYVHVGFYLGWIVEAGLFTPAFGEEAAAQIFRFKRKEISCTVLSELWDGYLGSEFFTVEGNMFTYYYYGGGLYQVDYKEALIHSYSSRNNVADSWENYERMKSRISIRFQHWKRIVG